jgi:DNA-directed RNA polymerase subunit RPC12/RpoP
VPSRYRCPACRSDDVKRSRTRHLFERISKHLFHITPYRCVECGRRFFRQRLARERRASSYHYY